MYLLHWDGFHIGGHLCGLGLSKIGNRLLISRRVTTRYGQQSTQEPFLSIKTEESRSALLRSSSSGQCFNITSLFTPAAVCTKRSYSPPTFLCHDQEAFSNCKTAKDLNSLTRCTARIYLLFPASSPIHSILSTTPMQTRPI